MEERPRINSYEDPEDLIPEAPEVERLGDIFPDTEEKDKLKQKPSFEGAFKKTIDNALNFSGSKERPKSEVAEIRIEHQNETLEQQEGQAETEFDKRHEIKAGEDDSSSQTESFVSEPTPISKILAERAVAGTGDMEDIEGMVAKEDGIESTGAQPYQHAIKFGFIFGVGLIVLIILMMLLTRLF